MGKFNEAFGRKEVPRGAPCGILPVRKCDNYDCENIEKSYKEPPCYGCSLNPDEGLRGRRSNYKKKERVIS